MMLKKKHKSKNKVFSTRLKTFVGVAVSAFVISGCTTYQPSYGPTMLRNKITVTEAVERLELYAGQAGLHLSARDEDAVAEFLSQYASSGQGPLYINVPSSGATSPGVAQAQSVIQSYLGRMGRGGANLQTGQYQTAPGSTAPVIVSYRRLTTAPIDCRQGASLTHTSNNQPYGNFGCAQTANLAALIDNPMQLLAPYSSDSISAARRMTIFGKYIEGVTTASEFPDRQEVAAGDSSR